MIIIYRFKLKKFRWGKDDIKTYHSEFKPVEWSFDLEREDNCYLKIVTVKSENEKVVGFHILSPNAGEITQGVALAIKMGVIKAQLDTCVGIHPTIAEVNFLILLTFNFNI